MDAFALGVLVGIVVICGFTFRAVLRDGHGRRPTWLDYDTRRPEP